MTDVSQDVGRDDGGHLVSEQSGSAAEVTAGAGAAEVAADPAGAPVTHHDAPLDVVGMGSSLVDILCRAPGDAITELGLVRGSMELVDLDRAERVYAVMGSTVEVSGGSAANTIAGVAALGGTAGFVGKLADDAMGQVFLQDIRAAGVSFDPVLAPAPDGPAPADGGKPRLATGRCLVLVTGDAERTMATYLGVATTIGPDDVPVELVARGTVLYLESYLWDMEPAKAAMRRAIRVAHDHNGAVALSLSDPFCVDRHRRELLDLIVQDVDVLFGNEEELRRLFVKPTLEGALAAAEETGILVAATRGPDGSVVLTGRGAVAVPAVDVEAVVDTTGAGDLYAAGFLYGLTHGSDPVDCARLGSLCAAEVIGHLGARPERTLATMAAGAGLS